MMTMTHNITNCDQDEQQQL